MFGFVGQRAFAYAVTRFGIGVLAVSFLLVGLPDRQANADYTAIVVDASNGNVLFQRRPDKEKYPASLTKMMTLYMIFEALENGVLDLHEEIPVSKHAESQRPSELGLRWGQTITVHDVIMSLITKSANDAAAAIAERLSGSSEWRFAIMMTKRARELGMRNTTFTNASGWHDKKMKSTARDMSILALRLVSDFPQHYPLFTTRNFKYGDRVYPNHNKLLGTVKGVDGIKTGYTRPAGWNLAASSLVDGRRIVAVIMGGSSGKWRNKRMTEMLQKGRVTAANNDRDVPSPGSHPMRSAGTVLFANVVVPNIKPETSLTAFVKDTLDFNEQLLDVDQGSAAGDHSWSVQIGAFAKIENAKRARKNATTYLEPVFGKVSIAIIAAATTQTTSMLYRVRIVDLTESRAHKGCQVLNTHDLPCAVLHNEG